MDRGGGQKKGKGQGRGEGRGGGGRGRGGGDRERGGRDRGRGGGNRGRGGEDRERGRRDRGSCEWDRGRGGDWERGDDQSRSEFYRSEERRNDKGSLRSASDDQGKRPAWGKTGSELGGDCQKRKPAWGKSPEASSVQERKPAWGKSSEASSDQERKPAWGKSPEASSDQERKPAWGKSPEASSDVTASKVSSLKLSSPEKDSGSVFSATESQPLKGTQEKGSPSGSAEKKQPEKSEDTTQRLGKSPPDSTRDDDKDLPLQIPPREPNSCGTSGRPIKVETNHLRLNLGGLKQNVIYMYDVEIEPDRPKKMFRLAVKKFLAKKFPNQHPAYDGNKIMFSVRELGDVSDKVEVSESEIDTFVDAESAKVKSFTVTIKFATNIDLSVLLNYMNSTNMQLPQQAIQAVDVILRQAAAFKFVAVGRSYFTEPRGRIVQLGNGMVLWAGFCQSAILGWESFLNIDVAHKGFPRSQHVLDLICEFNSDKDYKCTVRDLEEMTISPGVIANLSKFLKGLKVNYEVLGRKIVYRVNGMTDRNSTQIMLKDKIISVYEYFKKERGFELRFPNLPLLHVGNPENKLYIPVECCTISEKQAVIRKLTETQTSKMVRYAATSPSVRKQKIMDAIQKLIMNVNPSVREFGLSVDETFTQVDARVLKPPTLLYGNDELVTPRNGVWNFDKYFTTSPVAKWSLLNFNQWLCEDDLRNFAKMLVTQGTKRNMNIQKVDSVLTMRPPDTDVRKLTNYLERQKQNGVSLVVVVIPDRGKDVYSNVKKTAEKTVGILTQCVKATTLKKASNATVSNILLKVNAKINGINYTLNTRPKCLERPVMFVGADVTHPSPDQRDIPSIAAVCASHDAKGLFQYNMECRLQPPRTEIIQDLEQMIVNHLYFFYAKTKLKPEKIFYFRDGVSEGEFKMVMNMELSAIRRACKRVQKEGYEPPITFLVVQKRHHTRFFPANEDDKNENVPAGTIVDTVITHPTDTDYYLVSHKSHQGTSRPTRYRLLWDDNNPKISEDELEQLTYYLCHMFTRCTRSVSYPAPTYYAHLAASRARVYTEGISIDLDDLQKHQHEIRIKKFYPMFFV